MSLAQNVLASHQSHLAALRTRHEELSTRVEQEQSAPGANEFAIKQLKVEKLRLKEEIARAEELLH